MDATTIVFIHEHLTEYFLDKDDPISPPGVKNIDTIESAAMRPEATIGGEDAYPTIFLKAASLFHSICGNHSFHNGNKRAALLSTLYYLSEEGYWVDKCDDDEMYEFTRKIAAHELCDDRSSEVGIIADWLEQNSRRNVKGDKQMKFNALKEALARFDFELVDNGKLYSVIKDGTIVETILKKGQRGFEDYDPPYISELRKRLGLTPLNGIDSARFYGQRGIAEELNEFMQIRLDVMKRLAKI